MSIKLIAEIIGGFAALFRISSLFSKVPERIKFLVTIGNFLFMVQGFINNSPSLIISNGACLIAYLVQYVKSKSDKRKTDNNVSKVTEK